MKRALAAARAQLDQPNFQAAQQKGRKMSLEEALQLAL